MDGINLQIIMTQKSMFNFLILRIHIYVSIFSVCYNVYQLMKQAKSISLKLI